MAMLNDSNSSVDTNSGAVIFHKSPELTELIKLKQEVKALNHKVDVLLSILLKEEPADE